MNTNTNMKLEIFDSEDGMILCLQDFMESCKNGSFVDHDGYGELATVDRVSRFRVSPSEYRNIKKQVDDIENQTGITFSHVLWYNK